MAATFTYRCAAGHLTDRTFGMNGPRPKTSRCGQCPRRAALDLQATYAGGVGVIPDLGEHYNPTIGAGVVVTSRRHLQSLQRQHGLVDFEPSSGTREALRYGREKMLRDAQ